MNDHHIYRHPHEQQPQNNYNHNNSNLPGMSPLSQRRQTCPAAISTYATQHLDSSGKILNHVVAITVVCDVALFVCSFSVAYLDHLLGLNTGLCSFMLCTASVTVWLIVNNSTNRISALSFLAPTEFMVGLATGLSVGAAVLSAVLSAAYQTGTVCDKIIATAAAGSAAHAAAAAAATTSTSYDAVVADTCANHVSHMTAIWFWAGLVAWLNVVTSMLLATGRQELSAQHRSLYNYETIGGVASGDDTSFPQTPTHFDFEETFRRQQQEILGVHQAAAVRERAAAMFVGDYATIPEVTHGSVAGSGNTAGASSTSLQQQQQQQQQNGSRMSNGYNQTGETAQILSV
jgi:hypothetical protein